MANNLNNIPDINDGTLQSNRMANDENNEKTVKRLKQILHFCDGDLEVYSSEDEVDTVKDKAVTQIDPKTLNWLPWTWYQTTWVSSKILNGCDYVGECLADFFGITAPKYQFEIDEYYRQQKINKEMQNKEDLEMGGWNEENRNNCINMDKSPITNATLL